jgi:magnesium transporter
MAADEDEVMKSLVMNNPPIVRADDSTERAAWVVSELGESEAAVVTSNDHLVGIVPASSIISILVGEHAEDMARLGGFLHADSEARKASTESVLWRLWHRLPWLLVGLAGAILAAILVSGFEEQLAAVVSLSFFVPAIVYLANAVGGQTQSIAVRGLTVGVGIRSVLLRELITGFILGAILGIVFIVPAYLLAHDWHVAVAVGLSLFVASGLANLTALGMPWLLTLFRADPAFGSGPVATVVQDLSSIVAYLAIASVLVPGI